MLVHTPYLRPDHDWDSMLPEYRRVILEKLKRTAGMRDIESRIAFEQVLTPSDIDRRYHVLNGAIYGLASHGRFLGAFKPGNRSPDLRGLYLAGGAAHPGPGMPMVLMSGWIAADALDQDASGETSHHVGTESSVSSRALPRVSAHAVKIFAAYSRRYMRRRFHAIRILKCAQLKRGICRPLVIYLNHASWWDPLVCLYLSRKWFSRPDILCSDRRRSLTRYGIFKHIGMYGVEQHSVRGTMTFLRTTSAILRTDRNVVWLTPQGRFMDVRERPLRLRCGIGALATRTQDVEFLPLAIEYPFWTEPSPRFSSLSVKPPSRAGRLARSAEEWTGSLQERWRTRRMNWPAAHAGAIRLTGLCSRKAHPAVNSAYDAWRMIRARLGGAALSREHRPEKWT